MLNEGAVVTKAAPCPVCLKGDWCYSVGHGDKARLICRRLNRDGLSIPSYLEVTDKTDKEGDFFLKLKVEEKAPRPDKIIEYIYSRDNVPVLKVITKYFGGKKQGAYPYLWEGTRWASQSGLNGIEETSIPLFNQEAVIETDKSVFLVEGESCAKALNDLGFVATTIRGKTFSQEHLEILRSKKAIVLCPDRDVTGVDFMAKAYLLLSESNTPLRQLLAPPHEFFWHHLPSNNGLDVADWIGRGVDRQAIISAVTHVTDVITGIADNTPPDVDIDEHTRLEQSVKFWLSEPSLIKQTLLGRKIRREHQLDKATFDKLAASMMLEMSTAKPVCRNAGDFMAEGDNEIVWLLSNLIAKGEMILLSGSPGRGKSVLAMFLMHKMLREGSTVLNERVMKPCKILFISGDQSDRTTRKRFWEMGSHELPEFANNVRILSNFSLETMNALESELEKFRPDLVVIDSLTSITLNSGVAEKDPEFAHAIYRLKDLCSRYDAASILIHHLNKSGIESGSLRILAAVWAAWRIESTQPDNPNCTLNKITMPKVRDSERMSLEIQYNPTDEWREKGVFTYVGESGSGTLIDDVLTRSVNVLREFGTLTSDELAVRANTTTTTLRQTMNRARNKGLVEPVKIPNSKYNAWKLTEKADAAYPRPSVTVQPKLPMRHPNISDPTRQDLWEKSPSPPMSGEDDEFF